MGDWVEAMEVKGDSKPETLHPPKPETLHPHPNLKPYTPTHMCYWLGGWKLRGTLHPTPPTHMCYWLDG